MNKIISKNNAINHYKWGDDCDSWDLTDGKSFSVKQEKMPSGTFEQLHYHEKSSQFFFILEGIATFEIEEEIFELNAHEGIEILPGTKHRIVNNGNAELEFLLFSEPAIASDRINI